MNTTHPKTTPSDARLFLIKHLLLLKQQIVAFDIEYVHQPSPSLDFSSLTTTFYELRTRGSIFDPRNLWRLMTNPTNLFPKVVENMLDAKVELDGRLRTVINDFTTAQAGTITQPIDTSALAKPKFDPLAAVTQVKALAEKEVPPLRKRLESYLTDLRTRETLVAAIRDQVLLNYESFYDLWTEKQAKEGKEGGGKTRSKKGKGREGEVWDVDMFEEWAGGVFGVREFGLLGNHDNDDRDDDDNRNHGNDDDDDDDGGDSSAVSRDGSV